MSKLDSNDWVKLCRLIGKDITPYELGKIMNVKSEIYRRWKVGMSRPSLALLRDIGMKYGFNWEELYCDIYR